MDFICVTNNETLYNKYKDDFEIRFYNIPLRDIMVKVRDMVHDGHKILTHPLSGSVKPGETTIKSIFVTKKKSGLDHESLILIETSIEVCDKFVKRHFTYKKSREDFETVDLSLAESALVSMSSF
ncbi:GrdX family protein [Anaeropeptidivorans aminofermentans]|uniref:GrdX family protein n=1 Tax=Anaeropeptidivorans aminofermentans TaxID=2934315 RepID=UPI0020249C8E|nr:GrdX family protein [Anaeropeptidivorans aminofermentans]